MQLAWLTDIHLEFLEKEPLDAFVDQMAALDVDAFLIGGDIGNATNVVSLLTRLDDACNRPIYFVLGNHDFYYGSIHRVRSAVRRLCRERQNLTYLTANGVQQLDSRVALIGHDGWADAREGNYEQSSVMLNDYKLIDELAPFSKAQRKHILYQLAQAAVDHVRQVLPLALASANSVLFLTHVPPWRAACWHNGQISDDEWAPHFTCRALGDVIQEIMMNFPDKRLTVLCGHTHSAGYVRLAPNIEVYTGQAEYGHPVVNRVIDLDALD